MQNGESISGEGSSKKFWDYFAEDISGVEGQEKH